MNDSTLIALFVAGNCIAQLIILYLVYNLYKYLDEVRQDQRRIVLDMKMLQEAFDSLVLDGEVYLKVKDDVEFRITEFKHFDDRTGLLKGTVFKV